MDNQMAVLVTRGRNTGTEHAVPLLLLEDGSDWIVIASFGGRPAHPEWYLNLVSSPEAVLEVGGAHHLVEASTLTGAERDVWWARVVDAYHGYAAYQSRTSREIPIVRLAPVA